MTFRYWNSRWVNEKKDTSLARIKVSAESESLLGEILDELAEIGAMVVEIREVKLEAATKDKTLPADFYSTTNHPTYIRFQNEWIPVENIEMDCMIVVDPEIPKAIIKPIGQIKKRRPGGGWS